MKTKSRQELKKPKTRKEKKMQNKKQPSGKGQEVKAVNNNKKGDNMNKTQIEKRLVELKPAIKRIASKLTSNWGYQEDVYQVGLEAIYRKLMKGDDYNEAYLRQHAKHRMFNYLIAGKSLDNGVHNGLHETTQIELDEIVDKVCEKDLLREVYERDLKSRINNRLSGLTKRVFTLLSKGYTQNEIAKKLGTYQRDVSRQRQKIQDVVKKLYGDELTLKETRTCRK